MTRLRRVGASVLVPAAALCALVGTSPVRAEGPLPMYAAALNGGTVTTGIGSAGVVGFGIVAAVPVGADPGAVVGDLDSAVAGVQVQVRWASGTTEARAVTGDSISSALLNAGTATMGIGPSGAVGAGIIAVR